MYSAARNVRSAVAVEDLIVADASGLHCPRGRFHIDPWRPVDVAVVTHAHSDHARRGSRRIVAAQSSVPLLRRRLGQDAPLVGVPFGERMKLGDATVSLHPAGHILGSAQVRIEVDGRAWVVTGDYKRDDDPSCEPFELVECETLITEATFALPVYRWEPATVVARRIVAWWDECLAEGRAAILCCYALGKAQRLLAELGRLTDRPAFLHGALIDLVDDYRAAGVAMLPTRPASELGPKARSGDAARGELVLAPPSAIATPWVRRFGDCSTAFASGWMQLRGVRRRRGFDRGFALSDHADWPGLLRTIDESRCARVLTTHGYGDALVRHLAERGFDASVLRTEYGDEEGDDKSAPSEGNSEAAAAQPRNSESGTPSVVDGRRGVSTPAPTPVQSRASAPAQASVRSDALHDRRSPQLRIPDS